MSESSTIESSLNAAAAIGAVMGGPIGVAVEASLQAGEAVVSSVQASQTVHASALQTATAAAATLSAVAAPVVAALPAEDAVKATAGLNLLQSILADLKSIFSR